jgi:hypothetical protein
MNAKDFEQLKQYLKDNLKLSYDIQSDIYELNPDQITINLNLEGEVIDSIVLYSLTDN